MPYLVTMKGAAGEPFTCDAEKFYEARNLQIRFEAEGWLDVKIKRIVAPRSGVRGNAIRRALAGKRVSVRRMLGVLLLLAGCAHADDGELTLEENPTLRFAVGESDGRASMVVDIACDDGSRRVEIVCSGDTRESEVRMVATGRYSLMCGPER